MTITTFRPAPTEELGIHTKGLWHFEEDCNDYNNKANNNKVLPGDETSWDIALNIIELRSEILASF